MRSSHLILNLAGNALASLVSAFAVIVAIDQLSVAEWGLSALLLGIGQFLGSAMSFGSQTFQLRELSILSLDAYRQRARRFAGSRLLLASAGYTAGFGLFLIAPSVGSVTIAAIGVFVSLAATVPLLARRRYLASAIILFCDKVLALFLVFLFMRLGLGEYALPLAIGLASLPAGLWAFLLVPADIAGVRRPWLGGGIATIWKGGRHFGWAAIAPSALLLDVGIVGLISGAPDAAHYAIGSKLTAPLSVAATSIVQVFLPSFANLPPNQRRIGLSGRGWAAVAVAIVIASLLAIWIPSIVVFVFGSEYFHSAAPIRFFVLNALVVLFTRTVVTALQGWGHERAAGRLVVAQVVVALIGVAVGSWLQGASAASAAVFFSNLLLAGALILYARRIRSVEPESLHANPR